MVILVASKPIEVGQDLSYDYGERRKDVYFFSYMDKKYCIDATRDQPHGPVNQPLKSKCKPSSQDNTR